ncbi:chromosome segregation DNA-binding protein [Flavimobilis soli]|uniref:Chromosome segregation DNA-binding protein n=1 Tax=Flavimobilis soli TaxID=442709 RepID=A0A2A9ED97_9MICO|nr:ParB/RepB/Spo0J family partition protein [Flavimobilis soli]PFG36908.1 chromosome segregation DNA-binding protein [Flavimobilis soli]
MSEKRRGLGRGLGALIPTTSDNERPVDVFFAGGAGTGVASDVLTPRSAVDTADAEAPTGAASETARGPQKAAEATGSPSASPKADKGRARQRGTGEELVPVPGATFAEIPLDSIRPNSRQPRTVFAEEELNELIGSIAEIGVLQPIVVRPDPSGTNEYELIMGERRWRASREAGLTTIPAIVRDTEDTDLLRDALLENLHRAALNPLEEAAAYQQLLDDFGCTHEELATRISRSRPQISNTLRLLKLPALVQRRVAAGVLSAGHARALLGLQDAAAIERLAQRIVAEGLSVRATEEVVALGGLDGEERKPRKPRPGTRSAAIDELAARLSDRFETRVKVDLGRSKGKMTIEFASVEDLNRILDVLAPDDPGVLRKS